MLVLPSGDGGVHLGGQLTDAWGDLGVDLVFELTHEGFELVIVVFVIELDLKLLFLLFISGKFALKRLYLTLDSFELDPLI